VNSPFLHLSRRPRALDCSKKEKNKLEGQKTENSFVVKEDFPRKKNLPGN
jgi:hypothetical protein